MKKMHLIEKYNKHGIRVRACNYNSSQFFTATKWEDFNNSFYDGKRCIKCNHSKYAQSMRDKELA